MRRRLGWTWGAFHSAGPHPQDNGTQLPGDPRRGHVPPSFLPWEAP
jgi:hypothetical protein